MRIFEICLLREYKRDITIQKLGDKLAAAGKKDGDNKLDYILDVLEQIDPTRNKQYVEWLSKQYIKGQFRLEDYPRINELLINFEKVKSRLQQKDINRYDLYSLDNEIDKIFNVNVNTNVDTNTGTFEVPPDTKVLYNGPFGLLVSPETEQASCELGRGTKWCTSSDKNNAFDRYNSQSPLYIWRDKNGSRYQFHFSNDIQLMDAKDQPIDTKTLDYFRTKHPILSKFFSDKEKDMLKNPERAYWYARNVIKGRWPEAEPVIMKESKWAYYYAKGVIKGRWPQAEPVIMKESKWAYYYAKDVIKGRWPEAEPHIMKESKWAYYYAKDVIGERWPEAEPHIMKDPVWAYWYAKDVIGER